jgi:hypothetical protein
MLTRHKLTRTVYTLLPALAASAFLLHGQDPQKAKIIDLTGRVSLLQNEKFEKPLFLGDELVPGTLIVTGPDGYARVQVPDGSTFEVFPNARVLYRERGFGIGDLLNVIIGRVKVYIQHDKGPNPNRVSTPTAVISVRGTVFDVRVVSEDETLVSVDEGAVDVQNVTAAGNSVRLTPDGLNSIRVMRGQPIAKAKDIGGPLRMAMKTIRDAIYQVAIQQRSPTGTIPGARTPGSTPGGAQGDGSGKGNNPGTPPGPGTTTTGTSTPGTPPGPGGN